MGALMLRINIRVMVMSVESKSYRGRIGVHGTYDPERHVGDLLGTE